MKNFSVNDNNENSLPSVSSDKNSENDRPVRKKRKDFKRLKPVYFIALGFLGIILFGSFWLCTPLANENFEWISYVDALFTATSAVCVTGLAVFDTATQFSLFGELMILFLIQVGGLGFMTIASMLFLILGKKITLRERLAMQEAYGKQDLQGVIKLTKTILLTTLIIEVVGACFLMISFIPAFGVGTGIYYSIFHSISGFCNAGFDLMGVIAPGASLIPLQQDIIANLGIMFLIVLGGLGFSVIHDVRKNLRFSRFSFHTKVVLATTGILILFTSLMFLLFEWNNSNTIGDMDVGHKILASVFQAISPRTAGFATLDQSLLTNSSQILTMILMFIGASPASTGGGIKTTTFIIIIVLFVTGAKGESEIQFKGRTIQRQVAFRAVSILMFGLVIVFLGTFFINLIEIDILGKEGFSFQKVLFECVSGFGTVGLSQGITGSLSVISKLIITVIMFAGRLGTLALGLFAFSKKDTLNIKYPDAKIMVG